MNNQNPNGKQQKYWRDNVFNHLEKVLKNRETNLKNKSIINFLLSKKERKTLRNKLDGKFGVDWLKYLITGILKLLSNTCMSQEDLLNLATIKMFIISYRE